MIDTVVFDLDGTLINSEAMYLEANVLAASELGYAYQISDFYPLVGLSAPDVSRHLSQMIAPHQIETFEQRSQALFFAKIEAGAPLMMPEADQTLRDLQAKGYRLGLATSSVREVVARVLSLTGWQTIFDVMITGSEVSAHKPDPQVYQRLKAKLPKSSRPVAVEDTQIGVQAAIGAKWPVLMIPGIGQKVSPQATAILPDLGAIATWLNQPH